MTARDQPFFPITCPALLAVAWLGLAGTGCGDDDDDADAASAPAGPWPGEIQITVNVTPQPEEPLDCGYVANLKLEIMHGEATESEETPCAFYDPAQPLSLSFKATPAQNSPDYKLIVRVSAMLQAAGDYCPVQSGEGLFLVQASAVTACPEGAGVDAAGCVAVAAAVPLVVNTDCL